MPNTTGSKIDLEPLTVEELTQLIASATAMREQKVGEAKKALLREFAEKAAEIGVSPEAMLAEFRKAQQSRRRAAPKRPAAKSLPAKFRNPETGQTWSGRGHQPGWLRGKDREDFAVGR